MILEANEVEAIRRRFTGTQLARLAASHERLRKMLAEAERIAGESELLSVKAEKTTERMA